MVVQFYNKRGKAEQWIKEGKQAVKMTRLSCHRFRGNEVRLWLSILAYNLGNIWRRLALPGIEDGCSPACSSGLVKTVSDCQARPVLLADVGGRTPDARAVRSDAAADRDAAASGKLTAGGKRIATKSLKIREEGAVSEKSMGNAHDDASEALKSTESLSFSTAEGSLILKNRLPAVKLSRIRAEKGNSSLDGF